MSTRADDLIDRRRLRRKLTFWRVATFIVIALIVIASARWFLGDRLGISSDHVAKVRIEGTITEDEELLDRLDRIRQSEAVRGVIISIDSPGGTTVGGEAIFNEIRRLAEEKPVVAQVGTLAASAGYMVASATDFIVARQSSIVGSIGVIVQIPNVSELLAMIGIEVDEVKSSPLKAEPSPFNQTTEEERQMLASMVRDSYDWFVGLVAERREMSRGEVMSIADGSVFTGRQAMENGLVDRLGGEREAKRWLVESGLDENLQVVEWRPRDSDDSWLVPQFSALGARLLGLPEEGLLAQFKADRMFLDGLLSVWQPENAQLRD